MKYTKFNKTVAILLYCKIPIENFNNPSDFKGQLQYQNTVVLKRKLIGYNDP